MVIAKAFTKWPSRMPAEKKKPLHPEINFLPPLEMILSFFKKKDHPAVVNTTPQEPDEVKEQDVKRIIQRINNDAQSQPDHKTND
jgi:hypothetical protein